MRGKVKNRIQTNNVRTLRRSLPRFLSLLLMSLLGTMVFSGLMATAPDMLITLDQFLDNGRIYDLRVVSDMGLEQGDVDAIQTLDAVEAAEGVYSVDVIARWADEDAVFHVASMPEALNKLTLLGGSMPQSSDEIVVEEQFLHREGLSLGDKITLPDDCLNAQEMTIVGTVSSALYYNSTRFSQDRGTTSVGSGRIEYYAFVPAENFNVDYFTEIQISAVGAADLMTDSEAYHAFLDETEAQLESIREERQLARRDTVIQQAQDELTNGSAEAEAQLADAWAVLEDSRLQLEAAAAELADGRATLDASAQQLADSKLQLDEAAEKIASGEAELADSETTLDEASAALSEAEIPLNEARAQLDAAQAELDSAESQLNDLKFMLDASNTALWAASAAYDVAYAAAEASGDVVTQMQLQQAAAALTQAQAEVDAYQVQYDEGYAEYQAALEEYNAGAAEFAESEAEYNSALASYEEGLAALEEGRAELESGKADYEQGLLDYAAGQEKYEKGEADYAAGLAEYESGKAAYEDGLLEYEDAKTEVDKKLAQAQKPLDKLEIPTWYILDRTGYSTYQEYLDDSNSIRNLGTLFPIVFFAVAVLVSLISMNRMVEEDRLEIGTMKSLGFENRTIISKYLSFSLAATIVGSLLGAAMGLIIIPELIFNIYRLLFNIPHLTLTLQPGFTLLGFGLTVLCVCGTSVWTAWKVLKEKPSELMRGKVPQSGHRILLEYLPGLWNRLSFSRKVTVRNLFRYKKRALVTVGGIAGCAALMLAGFGVKDSIVDIPALQYYDIFRFDGSAYVTNLTVNGEKKKPDLTLDHFLQQPEIEGAYASQRVNAELNGYTGYMMTCEASEFSQIAEYVDVETGMVLTLEPGKVIINEKLAELAGLSVGDELTITDTDSHTYTLPISGIARNYFEHFAIMDLETYRSLDRDYEPNLVYFHTSQELTEQQQDTLSESLLGNSHVLNVSYRSSLVETSQKSLGSLNSVVLILIVLSAVLDFVVLYNLSNININERKRELATLKVLGFYDREVDRYINVETLILTVLGIILGLLLGIVLSHMVVATIEIERCRFINEVKPLSFVYTALMTTLFTVIVSYITHHNLMRIDMIDSLKSVE